MSVLDSSLFLRPATARWSCYLTLNSISLETIDLRSILLNLLVPYLHCGIASEQCRRTKVHFSRQMEED